LSANVTALFNGDRTDFELIVDGDLGDAVAALSRLFQMAGLSVIPQADIVCA
jgi:hypothetical protein